MGAEKAGSCRIGAVRDETFSRREPVRVFGTTSGRFERYISCGAGTGLTIGTRISRGPADHAVPLTAVAVNRVIRGLSAKSAFQSLRLVRRDAA